MVGWREQYPLEASKPMKKAIGKTFGFFIFLLFCAIFGSFLISGDFSVLGFALFILIAVLVVIFVIFYIYEVAYMNRYFYDLNGKNLAIKKGVFSVSEITLPLNRLQDVYVDQDILDRLFGLYDVHVSSATVTSEFLSHIDGVSKESAEKIKKILLAKIN